MGVLGLFGLLICGCFKIRLCLNFLGRFGILRFFVGVLRSHSEALTLHFESEASAKKAREILAKAPSVVVMDEPQNKIPYAPLHKQHE